MTLRELRTCKLIVGAEIVLMLVMAVRLLGG